MRRRCRGQDWITDPGRNPFARTALWRSESWDPGFASKWLELNEMILKSYIYIYYKVTKVTKVTRVTKVTKVTKYQSIHPLAMFLPTLSPGFLCRKFSFSIMVDAATWIPISVSVGKSGAQNLPAGSDTQLPFTVAHKFSFNLSGFSQNPKA